MKEEWKPIEGYEGLYEVSNLGRVKSIERNVPFRGSSITMHGKVLKPYANENGYCFVVLYQNTRQKRHKIHRLVAETFIPNPEKKKCINHVDGNKKNNRVDNLEWCTHSENNKHAHDNGLIKPKNIAKGLWNPDNANKNNTSGRKGVCYDKRKKKWMAQITINRKHIFLGYFNKIEDAIKAREEKERELL